MTTTPDQAPSVTVENVLDHLRATAMSEREKGDLFERLIRSYFLTDPLYKDRFEQVWMWSDWPENTGQDVGIDLVGSLVEGGLCAIQCKFYGPNKRLDLDDLATFFTESGKAGFSERLIVSTTDKWTKNAEKALDNQSIPVARIGLADLQASTVDWTAVNPLKPEQIKLLAAREPRPHQAQALADVMGGLAEADRGKLIMACGTGKTFTSLLIAQAFAERLDEARPARVLFLVPSISLMSQTVREWTSHAAMQLTPFAVCSDTKVGRDSEDLSRHDLPFPATTNAEKLCTHVATSASDGEGLLVVFSTYQSLAVIHDAQKLGLESFDLVICDEAHRTTGVTISGEDDSQFVKIHQGQYIQALKRLYMTATPRMFADATKSKAKDKDAVLWSMDDEAVFGKELHRLSFGKAVEQELLTDYKVVVLGIDEEYVSKKFQSQFEQNGELKLEDAVKVVGCWNGLSRRERDEDGEAVISGPPLRRAVAFAGSIGASKKITGMFENVADLLVAPDDEDPVLVEAEHVDGTMNSLVRNQYLDWLKKPFQANENLCRILSNAKCLSEGVDVPSLDAVLFLAPRKSPVDVVQAVGRVMRLAKDKEYGYIILPIGIPADRSTEDALGDNKNYAVVWEVLQALRAHDERFNATINKIELNKERPDQIQVVGLPGMDSNGHSDGTQHSQMTLAFPDLEEWRDAVYAQIVQKVGDRLYWEDWANDIAKIAERHVTRITALLSDESLGIDEQFEKFLTGLRGNLNESITRENAIEMLAQHLITKPVFDALFEDYDFAQHNPVSLVMQGMLDALEGQHIEAEAESLDAFYESVRRRADGIDNAEGKQRIITELYEKFFRNAFPKAAESLGIAYTPIEIVDFILRSVEHILNTEFEASLNDAGVHVLDPFTGTGTFIVRLLQSGLITADQLLRKYVQELHANEINLLAYYVAAVNIEATFHGIVGGEYRPFEGIVLTDTFQMHEADDSLDPGVFSDNNERVIKQKNTEIRVIIGNPPYSAGQTSANDNNQNLRYPTLDAKVERTYAAHSSAVNKNSLYDSYIRAFRWASDRIGNSGIVAFVSNGGYLDSNTADGMRKCLVEEFDTIYVFNLRGNQRAAGEQSRKEGGKVFGSSSRATIAYTFLVKTGRKEQGRPAKVLYRDIGDYLSREEKLSIVENSYIEDIPWIEVHPDAHGDWINQRRDDFERFLDISKIFREFGRGVETARDAWVYNSSSAALEENVKLTIAAFNAESGKDHPDRDPKKIAWSRSLLRMAHKNTKINFDPRSSFQASYRPFFKQNLYRGRALINVVGVAAKAFPTPASEDFGFYVVAAGSDKPWSVLATAEMPDLAFWGSSSGQFFPRYSYAQLASGTDLLGEDRSLFDEAEGKRERLDNIRDDALAKFEDAYPTESITKDDVFHYAYGLMHSPEYRETYAADLRKMLPRIPFVREFRALADAGRALADLHLNYEAAEPYEVEERVSATMDDPYQQYRVEKLAFGQGPRVNGKGTKDRSTVIYNSRITLSGIPEEAYRYLLGSRSAIEWIMDRYQIRVDKASGIVNDPNDWSREHGNPRYIIDLVKRIVTMSVETMKIVDALPPLEIEPS
jgi:predicted helicase